MKRYAKRNTCVKYISRLARALHRFKLKSLFMSSYHRVTCRTISNFKQWGTSRSRLNHTAAESGARSLAAAGSNLCVALTIIFCWDRRRREVNDTVARSRARTEERASLAARVIVAHCARCAIRNGAARFGSISARKNQARVDR